MTKKIKIGNLYIGGGEPIRIQSMTNTKTKDIEKTVEQILRLESLGCEIIRVAVPDMESAKAIEKSRLRFIFRLLLIFILIINLRLRLFTMELIR